jgi:hypothetical protein
MGNCCHKQVPNGHVGKHIYNKIAIEKFLNISLFQKSPEKDYEMCVNSLSTTYV